PTRGRRTTFRSLVFGVDCVTARLADGVPQRMWGIRSGMGVPVRSVTVGRSGEMPVAGARRMEGRWPRSPRGRRRLQRRPRGRVSGGVAVVRGTAAEWLGLAAGDLGHAAVRI